MPLVSDRLRKTNAVADVTHIGEKDMQYKPFFVAFILVFWAYAGFAQIHRAPIILRGEQIKPVEFHPLNSYRLFKVDLKGKAESIPFQIDERDQYGDFILPLGVTPNTSLSNGIFDYLDELSFMGDDVGEDVLPVTWSGASTPDLVYKILFEKSPQKKSKGAVFVGVYFRKPPALSNLDYVNFNLQNEEIITSRYRYRFDRKNYLVIRGADIKIPEPKLLLDSSTFYLRADLKYFITVDINQNSIQSALDAYKDGPIRSIARVNFNYSVFKLKLDLGMYTEVSFFPNSVILPAIIDNPLEGKTSLNEGSIFYYGFSMLDNPDSLSLRTNMPYFQPEKYLSFLKSQSPIDRYWVTATNPNYMMLIQFNPSKQMLGARNIPMIYKENTPGVELRKRTQGPNPLGKSPVNVGISFGLGDFPAGLHEIFFQLYVENSNNPNLLNEFKDLNLWSTSATKIAANPKAPKK